MSRVPPTRAAMSPWIGIGSTANALIADDTSGSVVPARTRLTQAGSF